MSINDWYTICGVVVLISPLLLLAVLGISELLDRPLSEFVIAGMTQCVTVVGLIAALGILGVMLFTGQQLVPIELGNWVVIPAEHFHFHLKFVFDRLSVPFVILTFVLTGIVGGFARSYLHREPGYRRYFLLYAIFLLGMVVTSLAGTIETLFIGWELVGLSSAFLIAFFQDRQSPVRNGLHVWTIYRFSDAAFLIAAIALHHQSGAGEFSKLVSSGLWPEGTSALTGNQALGIGLLLLVAAAGKSALVPFSGWLPRAMEGPTPSSAIFYGALSVHLGAFLLLRVSPILESSRILCAVVVAVGLATAVFAAMASRVQTDIKGALAFASMTQVGLIVAGIGLGFRYLALIHIIGHACLRTLQLLRAPTLLSDYQNLENAIGRPLQQPYQASKTVRLETWQGAFYRWAYDRGGFDRFLIEKIVTPFRTLFLWCQSQESNWTNFLAGNEMKPAQQRRVLSDRTEDLL